jgi:hypothetical protein
MAAPVIGYCVNALVDAISIGIQAACSKVWVIRIVWIVWIVWVYWVQ